MLSYRRFFSKFFNECIFSSFLVNCCFNDLIILHIRFFRGDVSRFRFFKLKSLLIFFGFRIVILIVSTVTLVLTGLVFGGIESEDVELPSFGFNILFHTIAGIIVADAGAEAMPNSIEEDSIAEVEYSLIFAGIIVMTEATAGQKILKAQQDFSNAHCLR